MSKNLYNLIVLIILFSCPLFASGKRESYKFPNHDFKIIVPYAKGGGTDSIARVLGASMEKYLGFTVHIVNILGGSGAIGMISGAASVPDGYTLTMVTRELVTLPALGLAQISKDDFKLLGLINKDPAVLVVSAESTYSSLSQIVRDAKNNPGEIRFASPAKPHFYILEFENRQDIIFNKIPYNGASKAINAVINGQADFTLVNPGEIIKWIKKGSVNVLAIMSDERSPSLPTVSTFQELGYNITSFTWRGLVVPLGTPESIRQTLAEVVKKACMDVMFINKMEKADYRIKYLNAKKFLQFINKDTKVFKTILEEITKNGSFGSKKINQRL